jgi:hypothetical protein
MGGFSLPPADRPARTDLGPCLDLGPAGQRCARPAQEGGFCAVHQPEGSAAGRPAVSARRAGVIAAILALLWPILADIVRELIRLFR